MKIGITGATGQLGRLVVEQLKQKNTEAEIVALVRDTDKASDLGVEVRQFDYNDVDRLEEALIGIDQLLLISSSEVGKRQVQHEAVISAAKKAGVKRLVYTSLLRADTSTLNLAKEHIGTEVFLKASGIPYTILRHGWYTENYTGSATGSVAAGAFIGSAGEGKISSASREDFAEAAAVVLLSTGHEGKTYELAGDIAYTLSDLAAAISKETGKDIPYSDLSEKEYSDTLITFGVPADFAPMIASWDVAVAKGDLYSEDKTLSQLIGRPTTPLQDTVKVALS